MKKILIIFALLLYLSGTYGQTNKCSYLTMNGIYVDSLSQSGYSLFFQVDGSDLALDEAWFHDTNIYDCNGNAVNTISTTWWSVYSDSIYTNSIYLPSSPGTNLCYPLTVEFIVSDPFIDTCYYIISSPTLNVLNQVKNNFLIYPNPTQDKIYLTNIEVPVGSAYTIFDLSGKLIIQEQITDPGFISLYKFKKGIYILRFEALPGRSIKIIKE